MKLELQFAWDSSTLLPKIDPIFRITITVQTSSEFRAPMKALLGKRSKREVIEYSYSGRHWRSWLQGREIEELAMVEWSPSYGRF